MIQIQEHVPLSQFSTFRIGGSARYFVSVHTSAELTEALVWAKEQGIASRIIAGGSNIVFPDEGIDCLIIRITGGYITVQGEVIASEAGATLMEVIRTAIAHGLAGIEQLSGIPGTIGGAVVGNAGAYGRNIGEVVNSVEILDGSEIRTLTQTECKFSYRHSIFKEKPYFVLHVAIRLSQGDNKLLEETSAYIIKTREKKYKPGIACPGSFFKNILASDVSSDVLKRIDQTKIIAGKIPAGYLLQEVGAPGMRKGGIAVADFHGNLLFNIGHGTAKEVKELASELKEKVKARFGILLEEEVRYF